MKQEDETFVSAMNG